MAIRVGDVGRALSPMSPCGAVEVNGERVDGRSDAGAVEAGSSVIVVSGDPLGYVVRQVEVGQPPPRLPGHGELIVKPEHRRTAVEATATDPQERQRSLRMLRYGSTAAGSLGAVVGLASGLVGWLAGWAGGPEPSDLITLLGGSLGVGVASALALFVLTGTVGAVTGLLGDGEVEFAPNFFAIFAALVGASVGFLVEVRGRGCCDPGLVVVGRGHGVRRRGVRPRLAGGERSGGRRRTAVSRPTLTRTRNDTTGGVPPVVRIPVVQLSDFVTTPALHPRAGAERGKYGCSKSENPRISGGF
jgi:hypothetical protein